MKLRDQPLGIFHDPDGDFSMMRLIAFIGACLAAACVLVGLVLAVLEVVDKRQTSIGVGLAGLGFGIFTSGALTKAWQAQAENKGQAGP